MSLSNQAQPVKRKPGRPPKARITDFNPTLAALLEEQDVDHHEKENATVLQICTGRKAKQRKANNDDDDDDDDGDGDEDLVASQASSVFTQPAAKSSSQPQAKVASSQPASSAALLAQLVNQLKHPNTRKPRVKPPPEEVEKKVNEYVNLFKQQMETRINTEFALVNENIRALTTTLCLNASQQAEQKENESKQQNALLKTMKALNSNVELFINIQKNNSQHGIHKGKENAIPKRDLSRNSIQTISLDSSPESCKTELSLPKVKTEPTFQP